MWQGPILPVPYMQMTFQVSGVQKPLASVKRIVEQGNIVCFGNGEGKNYIQNERTGEKIMMRPNGKGSYLMDLKFENGDITEVTVDRGAEESVCPRWWGQQYGTPPAKVWMNLNGAGGHSLGHFGERTVLMTPF